MLTLSPQISSRIFADSLGFNFWSMAPAKPIAARGGRGRGRGRGVARGSATGAGQLAVAFQLSAPLPPQPSSQDLGQAVFLPIVVWLCDCWLVDGLWVCVCWFV